MPKPGRWMVVLKKVLAGALALTAVWLVTVLFTVSTQATLDDGWTTFDESLIAPAVEDGKTVVVDVTADWCLTCKANKRLVMDQPEVEDAISGPNILRLQADWTQRNETIAAYLRKYGKYGVPFNIVYGPGAPNGIILNELLSKQEIMRALTEATDE
jgi:suppressor for copper-sensitivity B